MGNTALKELHDRLLSEKPDGADHDVKTCPMCAIGGADVGEGAPVKTYTEDEVKTAVSAAVELATGDLRKELADFRTSQETAEVESRITTAVEEATKPLTESVTELQTKLDAAVIEAQNEKARADGLETLITDAGAAAEVEARKEDRVAKVREAANFPDEYLTEHADRFAAMGDEEFEARLEEYRQIAVKATGTDGALPTATALKATQQDSGGKSKPGTAVRELFAMRRDGVDPRTL